MRKGAENFKECLIVVESVKEIYSVNIPSVPNLHLNHDIIEYLKQKNKSLR